MKKRHTPQCPQNKACQQKNDGVFYQHYHSDNRRAPKTLNTASMTASMTHAEDLISEVHDDHVHVATPHLTHADLNVQTSSLYLYNTWEVYVTHPDRPPPASLSEEQAEHLTWEEFLEFVNDPDMLLCEVTTELAMQFGQHMRKLGFPTELHNRKIRQLKKIFDTLGDFVEENPFSLHRKTRANTARTRKQIFTRKQENLLLDVLEGDAYQIKNKEEVRTLFYLGMFTGQSLTDCALLEWHTIQFKSNRVWVRQHTTGNRVSIPIAEMLRNVLKEVYPWRRSQYVLPNLAEQCQILDKNGKNLGANMLNTDIMRVIRWIGLEPTAEVPGHKKKVTVYGFHSLRHSFASHCVESGVPQSTAQSILKDSGQLLDRYYNQSRNASQKKKNEKQLWE